MKSSVVLLASLLLPAVADLPHNGTARERDGELVVYSATRATWLSPDAFFAVEIGKLGGPTYGRTHDYPPYEMVQQWQTLIDVLPDGRTCPMVFFHQRWRRLPDVLALDERLRNHGGCADVFKH